MFSGIVEAISRILKITIVSEAKHFVIARPLAFHDLTVGESIAVNGVCLTVTDFDDSSFSVTAVKETLSRTNLQQSKINDEVNLERAILMTTRIGGHFVQGHVDCVGTIISMAAHDEVSKLLTVKIPPAYSRYLINKGFVTLDGMSLTIIEAKADIFTVTLIPHTLAVTISKNYQPQDLINIEIDMIAKYIEKQAGVYQYAR